MPSVFFYISGHGFGHASREIEVINALGAAAPQLPIVVRTDAPRWIFERTVRVPFTLLPGACDTGVVQRDSLHLDAAATIRAAAAFYADLAARATAEASLLHARQAALVITDAPPLACAAAARAGIPAVVLANFTWDWIYAAYPDTLAQEPSLIPRIQDAYGQAAEGWRLPLDGGFETVPNVTSIPFIARHAKHDRDHTRNALGLPLDIPLALSSFGGYGVDGLDLSGLDCLRTCGVVVTGHADLAARPRNVFFVEERRVYDAGLRYEDLVAAVEVVVTKPGYGIISECIANRTAILYTSRGRFPEYDVMVAQMPRWLRSRFISHEDMFAGRWTHALEDLLAQAEPPERPSTNGAAVAAARIADRAHAI